jgi:Zn-dependent metalloprotease
MASRDRMIVFGGAKVDGRRVKLEREIDTGRVYRMEGFLSGPLDGKPEDAAQQFLDANRRLLKSPAGAIRELQVDKVTRSPAGYHVVLQQVHQGVPVEEGKVTVHMTPDQRVHAAYGRPIRKASRLDVERLAENGIDEEEAIRLAVDHVAAADDVAESAQATLVIIGRDDPRLSWRVLLSSEKLAEDWVVWVDSLTGAILRTREISME